MSTTHTEGPWRWEFNRDSKGLHLVGGRPRFDLTIMDFVRCGMGGAMARLRDTSVPGMNLMHRLSDRPDWVRPFEGRAHHASWCQAVVHPDMVLMQAAPDLLGALRQCLRSVRWRIEAHEAHSFEPSEVISELREIESGALTAIAKATGSAL